MSFVLLTKLAFEDKKKKQKTCVYRFLVFAFSMYSRLLSEKQHYG